jgi:hypothetical protein
LIRVKNNLTSIFHHLEKIKCQYKHAFISLF